MASLNDIIILANKGQKERPLMEKHITLNVKKVKKKLKGEPSKITLNDVNEMEMNPLLEVIKALIPLGLAHVNDLLQQEVETLAGKRYERKIGSNPVSRHGFNPGTVIMLDQKVPINVPRVRDESGDLQLESYQQLHTSSGINNKLFMRVLAGISCRDYEGAAESIPGAIGLSKSTVSRKFIEFSKQELKKFQERDLSKEDIVAIFLDGKTFAEDTIVIALGINIKGDKRMLGFVQTGTENKESLSYFLESLITRGLDISRGILAIIDGGKGLYSALKHTFKSQVVIQRCQWHKRENIVKHLTKKQQQTYRFKLQNAYSCPDYKEAKGKLLKIRAELEDVNISAALSMDEGFEETLTLHRLGLFGLLGPSFKTTNCIESINSFAEQRCSKIDFWKNSSQKQRWLAACLNEIEPRLRKVRGYKHLGRLRLFLIIEVGTPVDKREVA